MLMYVHANHLTCCLFFFNFLSEHLVPRVESISEESPVPERGLELLPVSNNNLANINSDIAGALVNLNPSNPEPIIATNQSCTSPDPLVHESELNTDLEANIQRSSTDGKGK